MRAILIDWLVEVHQKFKLLPDTLFLTVNIIDRFLQKKSVTRKNLQLVSGLDEHQQASVLLVDHLKFQVCLGPNDMSVIIELL